ncbi:MAG: bacillithiol system redox-active protein YtxJ [Vicinamibacterales bacterium]|nr:bacillithiol system redox-active protein YtxJ [Vicinamibacterales bacterium]
MSMRELDSLDALDAALAASASRPVVLFKHSRTCGTSAQAYDEVTTLLDDDGLGADVYVVPVQTSRGVSNAIASRFQVRHESPQVFVVHDGHVAWHASHFRVTAEAIARAVGSVAQPARS